MGFKGAKRMTADEQSNMSTLYDLIARTNKRKPATAKDEGADTNSTYEQNCKSVQEHWRKVNQRNAGRNVSIPLPGAEVGESVGKGAGKDSTDLTLEEQFEKHERPVGKDSFTQRNAIAARKNVVTVHKLESAEIVHKNIGAATKAYDEIMGSL